MAPIAATTPARTVGPAAEVSKAPDERLGGVSHGWARPRAATPHRGRMPGTVAPGRARRGPSALRRGRSGRPGPGRVPAERSGTRRSDAGR